MAWQIKLACGKTFTHIKSNVPDGSMKIFFLIFYSGFLLPSSICDATKQKIDYVNWSDSKKPLYCSAVPTFHGSHHSQYGVKTKVSFFSALPRPKCAWISNSADLGRFTMMLESPEPTVLKMRK